ncbi:MAG: AraC family transcriptional regulator [Hymenobacter sp.]
MLAAAGSQHALGLLYVESLTNALCHHLLEHHAVATRYLPTPPRLTRTVLARIDAYLEANAEASVTLEILADLANLSVFHFARLFKQATGMPPYQYVLQWKIRRAKHLLRLGNAPVADISDALGFASPASFSTAFRRAVGQSPQQFQRG